MTTLEVRGVAYLYDNGTRALDGVDLAFRTGERVAIVGRNGSGKSTLVRHFNGLLRPARGTVLVDGDDVATRRVAALAAVVGLVFQDPDRQIFAGTVRKEVGFGARNLGRRGVELDRAVDASLARVGLDGESTTNPYDLGYSRRKLLALASILAMETPVVVLDEPTTGQDARGIARIQAIVRELAAAGRTVIAVSHDMRFVADTFERVIVMRGGRVILDAAPGEAFAAANTDLLASTYLEAPLAARVAARLGLNGIATEAALVEALAQS